MIFRWAFATLVGDVKIDRRLWSKFHRESFIIFFSQSSFDPLSFSDSNLFLTAFNDSLLESLDAVSLQRLTLFAFLLLRLLGLIANAFLPKRLFGSSNDYRADCSTASWNK